MIKSGVQGWRKKRTKATEQNKKEDEPKIGKSHS